MATTESVTILMTDLVGSTELSYSLAPHQADDLRRSHFATLRKAIAGAGGTEIKNLGDGVMVAFPAASSALSCAVTMQQWVELENRRSDNRLGLRVGISGGEATKEGDDYFGDPVIEAARLCNHAVGGRILSTEFVRSMAGRRNPHVFQPLGELDLKGLPEPLEAVEIGWEPLSETAGLDEDDIPIPRRLTLHPATGVIGRQVPLETLRGGVQEDRQQRGTRGDAHLGRGGAGQDYPGRRSRPASP